MISMARIFGAPETVPAGKQDRKASMAVEAVVDLPFDMADDMHDM